MDDLVDLEREQQRRGDEREVLGPPLGQPQPDGFYAFQQPEGEQRDAEFAEGARAQREQLVELAEDADMAAGLDRTTRDATLQIGQYPGENRVLTLASWPAIASTPIPSATRMTK